MKLEATYTTCKATLRTSVVAGLIPASRASLRGMPRVNPSYRQAAFFRLVRDEGSQLSKRPAMHAALRCCLALGTHALANIGEVFEYKRTTRFGTLDELFGQDMIAVTAKPGLLVSEAAHMSFGTLRATLLQAALEAKVTSLGSLPGFPTEELIRRGDSRMCKPEIDADNLLCLDNCGYRASDHDMQPPATITMPYQVSRIHRQADIFGGIVGEGKRYRQATSDRGEANRACVPRQRIGMHIVARRTGVRVRARAFKANLMPCESRLQGFRSFDTRLNQQIRDESRARSFLYVVGCMMQLYAVLFGMLPAIVTHIIKCLGKLPCGVSKRLGLIRCRLKLDSYGSLHKEIIPYATRFYNDLLQERRVGDSQANA
jgi:hypothetical protein